jgi:hypothetical protein
MTASAILQASIVRAGVSTFDSPAWVPECGFPDLLKETSAKKAEWRREMKFLSKKRENKFSYQILLG